MSILVAVFWLAAAIVVHTYVLYPLIVGISAKLRPREVRRVEGYRATVSVLLAAFNEEATIGRRVSEFVRLLEAAGATGEVLVVSDGSTDGTASIVEKTAEEVKTPSVSVRLLALPANRGKAVAISEGANAATGEILILADARQTWADDAVAKLLENFADPEVGAVSGELMIESSPGVLAGVGLYWKFEKWLRSRESRAHSMVGVTGAICSVRRELFRPIPEGTILDDVYWPLRVAMQRRRVIFDGRALAYDRLPDRIHDEFRRKVRTLSGNYQLVMRLPGAVLPGQNPIWFAFVSHKLCRLIVPWALIATFIASLALGGPIYATFFIMQAAGYVLAIVGLSDAVGKRVKIAAAGASFLVLNAAAWLSFWVWITGGASKSWRKAKYEAPA